MTDTPSTEDILHSKALDAISRLVSQYEAGRITAESFKVGANAVWECLSGVVRSDEFEALIREANVYAAGLPNQPKVTILRGKSESLILLVRDGESVGLAGAKITKQGTKDFTMEDEAISYVRKTTEQHQAHGWTVT